MSEIMDAVYKAITSMSGNMSVTPCNLATNDGIIMFRDVNTQQEFVIFIDAVNNDEK